MLNTLANHEYLPHNGRDFTLEQVKYALKTALNFTDEFGKFLNDFALTTNPDKNASTWGLDTLSNHNILEHDASLRYIFLSLVTRAIIWSFGLTLMIVQSCR